MQAWCATNAVAWQESFNLGGGSFMTIGGWITMIISNVAVWAGTIWCFAKVLQTPQHEQVLAGFGP